jgi:hypothetical protein
MGALSYKVRRFQVLRVLPDEIPFLQEKGIIAMMQISLEMLQGIALFTHLLGYAFVAVFQFAQGIWTNVRTCHHVQILSE